MFHQLLKFTHSNLKALDILYVLEGAKPVSRIIVSERDPLLSFLQELGLHVALSDFKIIQEKDRSRNFSDKGIKVSRDDPRTGDLFCYVSKKGSLADKARRAESRGNSVALGRLLGYPECCITQFKKEESAAAKRNNDFISYSFRASKGISYPWQANYCMRVFDISLISHFPCSFHCQGSLKIAVKNRDIIEKHDPDMAAYFSSALKGGVIYTDGLGVFALNKLKIEKDHISYQQVIPSTKNEFFSLLDSNSRIIPLAKSHFIIGNAVIRDDYTFFGLFS